MPSKFVSKHIHIYKRQASWLKLTAVTLGLSQSEIIRQVIDRNCIVIEIMKHPLPSDRSAWKNLVAFLDARDAAIDNALPFHLDRSDIYEEREDRWLREN